MVSITGWLPLTRTPLTILLLLLLWSPGHAGGAVEYDEEEALAISQAAIGNSISDYRFRDRRGQNFSLHQLRGKPVVISLIYTSCYHVCPMMTEHLARSVDIAREALGQDSFSVVTIGFDVAVDTPDRMRMFAKQRNIDAEHWYFLSADFPTITALSEELGFIFFPSPMGFEHLTQTSVLDRDGRVYRQVYGQKFPMPALVEPLKELVFDTPPDAGLLSEWLNDVLLFCTVYDPNSGRYRFDYSIFVGIFVGVLCLGAAGTFIFRAWKTASG